MVPELLVIEQVPTCPRCGTPGLLAAHVPHGWVNANGVPVEGTAIVVLCEACGSDDPSASALVTFFKVHGQVGEATVHDFVRLARAWIRNARVPAVDPEAFESDVRAWRCGAFDEVADVDADDLDWETDASPPPGEAD